MSEVKDNSFRRAFYHIKMADEYLSDHLRELPMSAGAGFCKRYLDKLRWIQNDFKCNAVFPKETTEEFMRENEEDAFTISEIARKALLLASHQRESLERVLELLIKGEEVTVMLNTNPNNRLKIFL